MAVPAFPVGAVVSSLAFIRVGPDHLVALEATGLPGIKQQVPPVAFPLLIEWAVVPGDYPVDRGLQAFYCIGVAIGLVTSPESAES
ncbi:hypothetical protein ES703_105245 [subsurface metagenome]